MLRLLIFLTLLLQVALACQSSGSCGCCGCRAKAKARAAKTQLLSADDDFDERDDGNIFGLSVWNRTDLVVKDTENRQRYTNPNFLFHRCCDERKLPAACVQHCHFNTFDRALVQSMYVGSHGCPLEFLPEMQFCAAQGMDHRRCCTSREVHRTSAGGKCLLFCDQRPDLFTPLDYSYAPCFERFEDMKRCFYEDVKASAEAKFAPLLSQTSDSPNRKRRVIFY